MPRKKKDSDEGSNEEQTTPEQNASEQDAEQRPHLQPLPGFEGNPPSGLPSTEAEILELGKILRGKEFESLEEARDYVTEQLKEGGLDFSNPTEPETPLEQAQELIYEAYESDDPDQRATLAEEALEISSDCADAYTILAQETAEDAEEAKELYEQGLAAGERAIGENEFEESKGHFWGILETRPYMRAKQGLALCLWDLGERALAIEHYRQMLELNPNDNQGIRDLLAESLLEEDRDEELGKLLADYEEDASATWVYTRALWLFRNEGATEEAGQALKEAEKSNPHVPNYLLGEKKLPATVPALIGMGDETEAEVYFADCIYGWLKTTGALDWLRENVG